MIPELHCSLIMNKCNAWFWSLGTILFVIFLEVPISFGIWTRLWDTVLVNLCSKTLNLLELGVTDLDID